MTIKKLQALSILALLGACSEPRAQPDAAVDSPPLPDADTTLPYPSAPYGTATGDVIQPHAWLTYIDSAADSDDDPLNEDPRMFSLREVYTENDPGAKVILINASAGWCSVCKFEVTFFNGWQTTYGPQGFRIVHTLFEDATQGEPAGRDFVYTWGTRYGLKVPLAIDSTQQLLLYFDETATPLNMWVDARPLTLIDTPLGFSQDGSAEQAKIVSYLAAP